MPILNGKGDGYGSVALSTTHDGPIVAQAAYAPIGHLMLMADGMVTPSENDSFYSKQSAFDAGLGYFTALSKAGRFALLGGAGAGHTEFSLDVSPTTPSFLLGIPNSAGTDFLNGQMNFHRYFLETDLGFANDAFMAGTSLRYTFLHAYAYHATALHRSYYGPFRDSMGHLLQADSVTYTPDEGIKDSQIFDLVFFASARLTAFQMGSVYPWFTFQVDIPNVQSGFDVKVPSGMMSLSLGIRF
ncbi:MAG TPA: hypothetical protein VFD13_08580 [Candidatus Kapabacteria bacterium]|nr:hypothetical protein [Candidatus Kapabacteria bacterium]